MKEFDRRDLFKVSAMTAACLFAGDRALAMAAPKPMRLGVFIGIGKDPAKSLAQVHDLGFPTCQIAVEDFSPAVQQAVKAAIDKYQIEVTALDSLGPGPHVWDFYQGPLTIGLVPEKYRRQRIDHFKRASDFAKQLGIPAFHTHNGFIPENPNDPVYGETVKAIR